MQGLIKIDKMGGGNEEKKMKENIYIPKGTLISQMVQKCSYMKVLEIFFKEPTSIHFIKEISKKIKLAPPSVRLHMADLIKEKFIVRKESKPFDGYVANRENESFIYSKRFYNFLSLEPLKNYIMENLYPKSLVLFGSYCLGEDVEESDIDILIVSNSKKDIDLLSFEKTLSRKINFIFVKNIKDLDEKIQAKIKNGIVLGGFLDG